MTTNKRQNKGFTLIEMLLVLVIMSGIIYIGAGYLQQRTLSLRIDRTSGQMQQILNAGMSYYINSNNTWPGTGALDGTNVLQTGGYLPLSMPSPWNGVAYNVYSTSTNLYVSVKMPTTTLTSVSIAKTIAGTLPLAFTDQDGSATTSATPCATGSACYVIASVNIPSQKLGNAEQVSFAGLYHSGACVPAPTCPNGFIAQAFAVPVAVNAYFEAPAGSSSPCTASDKSGCIMTYYPLSGYTAYTTSDTPVDYPTTKPINCGTGSTTTGNCYTDYNNTDQVSSGKYWRVCISVTTGSGPVNPIGDFQNPWGQLTGTVMVMTRCQPPDENVGSGFTVWEPNS